MKDLIFEEVFKKDLQIPSFPTKMMWRGVRDLNEELNQITGGGVESAKA